MDGIMDKLGIALDAYQHSNGTHQPLGPPDSIGDANYEVILKYSSFQQFRQKKRFHH